ncbi:glucose 1-dehydrogenase [Rhizobium sp. SEMIA 4085]|uniref:Short-chain dehydrogenase/reductase SDR family protein n=1 Tax=Rhizobium gallicum bv. gallicum R602sp TaxID=1041138 RepID=A0A0B4XCE6_9HYPH|nr:MULTISPECIES: glucose 1-dehydrogenase [Rhizobium]AJD44187.1 short-chain dehydrogenase/reductase SDR family protein [Rhizobium gallicum bv. gallicum R602sp]NNH31398.1 glucose 1-dehydrogenase [Rhizobium sp. SEMIA 4085]
MKFDFENKVALVTGAASGMGLATAKAFAAAGAAVALVDVNEDAVKGAAHGLIADGHRVIGIRCDVANMEEVETMVTETIATFGGLDAAFNNAGVKSPVAETALADPGDYDFVMGVNLRGIWNCMKSELLHMREQGSGTIVNNSSLGGLVGIAERGIYHASKHGVVGLTRSAGLEYAPKGIRINAICPGIIATPMVTTMLETQPEAMEIMMKDVPIGRLGRAEEIADAVLWLSSPASTFVIGHALPVDGGYTVR